MKKDQHGIATSLPTPHIKKKKSSTDTAEKYTVSFTNSGTSSLAIRC